MAPIPNGKVILNARPEGYPEPGKTIVYDTSETIDLDNISQTLGKDEMLLQTVCLSADPYMRNRMDSHWQLGETILGFGIGKVIESNIESFKKGDHVYGLLHYSQYDIVSNQTLTTDPERPLAVLQNEQNLPWSHFIGIAGMPGKTAWYGWKELANAKKGDTVFVSAGAGAVGSLVIQLAKQDGLKVIASAGSDEKVEYLKELGADVAFNYKTSSTKEILEKEGPLNVYWDNVGGETLDAAIGVGAPHSRFIVCGMISQYNHEDGMNLKNIRFLMYRQIHIIGFYVGTWEHKYASEFYDQMPKLIKEGKIKFKEQIFKGLDKAGEALRDQQIGKNWGKCVIQVSED